jgi:homocysteine S-methyltransferase
MTTVGEAVGIARAAKAHDLPHVISFTVETDGRCRGGASLREAVEGTDEATGGSPAWYMINCAHPTHFEGALARASRGQRASAASGPTPRPSAMRARRGGPNWTTATPTDLGRRYRALREAFPSLRVLGGCCGTDHRHVAAIRDACLPA